MQSDRISKQPKPPRERTKLEESCILISKHLKALGLKVMERGSIPLVIREMQGRPTVRHHLTPNRVAFI